MICEYLPFLCEILKIPAAEAQIEAATPYCVADAQPAEAKRCLCVPADSFKSEEVKSCLNRLLYRPGPSQTQKGLLSIIVLRSKAEGFAFLKGFTKLWAIGSWRELDDEGRVVKEYPEEQNVQIDVEFRDRPDGNIRKGLMVLLGRYNELAVGENLLYVRFTPVLDSSL